MSFRCFYFKATAPRKYWMPMSVVCGSRWLSESVLPSLDWLLFVCVCVFGGGGLPALILQEHTISFTVSFPVKNVCNADAFVFHLVVLRELLVLLLSVKLTTEHIIKITHQIAVTFGCSALIQRLLQLGRWNVAHGPWIQRSKHSHF